jgi:hypothetical protein
MDLIRITEAFFSGMILSELAVSVQEDIPVFINMCGILADWVNGSLCA